MFWVLLGVGAIAYFWWRAQQPAPEHRAIAEAGPMAWDRWEEVVKEAGEAKDEARMLALIDAQRSRAVEELATSINRVAESLMFLDDVEDVANHGDKVEVALKAFGDTETFDRCLYVLKLCRMALAHRDNLNLEDYEEPSREFNMKGSFDTLRDFFKNDRSRFRSTFVNVALGAVAARDALLDYGGTPTSFAKVQSAYVKAIEFESAFMILGLGLTIIENPD